MDGPAAWAGGERLGAWSFRQVDRQASWLLRVAEAAFGRGRAADPTWRMVCSPFPSLSYVQIFRSSVRLFALFLRAFVQNRSVSGWTVGAAMDRQASWLLRAAEMRLSAADETELIPPRLFVQNRSVSPSHLVALGRQRSVAAGVESSSGRLEDVEPASTTEGFMSHEKYRECIEACHACAAECEHCATACLHEEDIKMMVRCIELDRSCADVCHFAAREMARGSDFAERACELCAEVCDACAEECAKHEMDHCQACADACRRCAEECRSMASA
jgi:hypothetical protein